MTEILDYLAGKILVDDGCWEWAGAHTSEGYASGSIGGKWVSPHRASYEALVGPIPEGLELDHLCRNRGCVRPNHLEPVTHAENIRRGQRGRLSWHKTHCKRGHELAGENLYIRPNGNRTCKTCNLAAKRRMYWRNVRYIT